MKKLSDLTCLQYYGLKDSGMLLEIYPEATGIWEEDRVYKPSYKSFNSGDKVVPINDIPSSLPSTWQKCKDNEQPFMYVLNPISHDAVFCGYTTTSIDHWTIYNESDLKLYEEPYWEPEKQHSAKFKIGDKVVPHSKSTCSKNLNDSIVWKQCKAKNQSYMFLAIIHPDGTLTCKSVMSQTGDWFSKTGDWFLEQDLTLYQEPECIPRKQ